MLGLIVLEGGKPLKIAIVYSPFFTFVVFLMEINPFFSALSMYSVVLSSSRRKIFFPDPIPGMFSVVKECGALLDFTTNCTGNLFLFLISNNLTPPRLLLFG